MSARGFGAGPSSHPTARRIGSRWARASNVAGLPTPVLALHGARGRKAAGGTRLGQHEARNGVCPRTSSATLPATHWWASARDRSDPCLSVQNAGITARRRSCHCWGTFLFCHSDHTPKPLLPHASQPRNPIAPRQVRGTSLASLHPTAPTLSFHYGWPSLSSGHLTISARSDSARSYQPELIPRIRVAHRPGGPITPRVPAQSQAAPRRPRRPRGQGRPPALVPPPTASTSSGRAQPSHWPTS